MNKTISITTDLRDYIERLHYQVVRYSDLLCTVNRECCRMTDDEWNSSFLYYQGLYEEADAEFSCAMDMIYEMYGHEIGNENWRVDFHKCAIVIGNDLSNEIDEMDESYADQLDRLFPRDIDGEIHINDNRAKDITLQVTDACNMACTYCYQHDKGAHSMSFDTGKRFLDMILDSDDRTNQYITSENCNGAIISFIGGEPWIEIELISKLSDYFLGELFRRKHPWAIKFMFSICSNGLLHFDERVQSYLERHKNHLHYGISIDGNKELHDSCRVDLNGNGTYERAIAAVSNYVHSFGGRIGSKMTIAPGNVCYVYKAVKSMIEYGYRSIHLNCVYEKGWETHHATDLYWQLHKLTDWLVDSGLNKEVSLSIFDKQCGHPLSPEENMNWCGGTGLMLAVDWKGDIYPCLRYMESSVGDFLPAYIIGSVSDGIMTCDTHCNRVQCLSCITRRSQSTDECYYCPIASGCGWCSAYNYEVFGTPDQRATFICIMHKARALANVYYWRKSGVSYEMDCKKEWAVEIIGEDEYENLSNMKVGDS